MMETDKKEASKRGRARTLAGARRLAAAQRRNDLFQLMLAGFSCERIAEQFNMTPAAVRRTIDRQVAARRLATGDSCVQVQVARLENALAGLDAGVDRGDVRSVDRLIKIVAQLDRYHGFAPHGASSPPVQHRLLDQARRAALPAPARAIAHQPERSAGAHSGEDCAASSDNAESGQN